MLALFFKLALLFLNSEKHKIQNTGKNTAKLWYQKYAENTH